MPNLCIYWRTSNYSTIHKLMEMFGVPNSGFTLNYETYADIPEDKLPIVYEWKKKGYIQIRNKKR